MKYLVRIGESGAGQYVGMFKHLVHALLARRLAEAEHGYRHQSESVTRL